MEGMMQCFWAFAGSLAFGVVFNIRGKNSIFAALGGLFAWVVYLLMGELSQNTITQFFAAAMAISFYAEFMAIWRKTPVTVFIISGMIPLVPGGTIFYTMRELIMGNDTESYQLGIYTIAIAGSIAMGILIASFVVQTVRYAINQILDYKGAA
ncbi:MAG: threonine/serine exporter family protein [Acetivibrio ethanolgignens]